MHGNAELIEIMGVGFHLAPGLVTGGQPLLDGGLIDQFENVLHRLGGHAFVRDPIDRQERQLGPLYVVAGMMSGT